VWIPNLDWFPRLNSSENTSIQYIRDGDVKDEILLQLNQNLLPSIELDRTELVGENKVLSASVDLGLQDGFVLPDDFSITVQSTIQSCEKNGVPFVFPDDDPFNEPEVLSGTVTGTLAEGDLTSFIEASTIIGSFHSAFSNTANCTG